MKRFFLILFVWCLPFLINASNDRLSKGGETLAKENLSKPNKKTPGVGFYYDYCLTYEWLDCDPTVLYSSTYCSPYSWEDVYNWSASMYAANMVYLQLCPQ